MTIGEILENEKKEWEYKASQLESYQADLAKAKAEGACMETIAQLTVKVIELNLEVNKPKTIIINEYKGDDFVL